jgi:hypothetical protein
MAASDPVGREHCGYSMVYKDMAKKYGCIPIPAERAQIESASRMNLPLKDNSEYKNQKDESGAQDSTKIEIKNPIGILTVCPTGY